MNGCVDIDIGEPVGENRVETSLEVITHLGFEGKPATEVAAAASANADKIDGWLNP